MQLDRALAVVAIAAWLSGCAASVFDDELRHAKNTGKPVFIDNLGVTAPNKDGEVTALAQVFNTSGNVYKYVDIEITAYNRVGDPVTSGDGASHRVKLRYTGPLPPRRTAGITRWPRTWYAVPVACLTIERVHITNIDESSLAIEGAGLTEVLASRIRRSCKPVM